MANQEHLAKLLEGVEAWNEWRRDIYAPNLQGANLREAYLRGVDLRDADLGDADLRGVNLLKADLSGAYFDGSDLRGADLREANLSEAKLRLANLLEANLSHANLSGADLNGAGLSKANLAWADISETDLVGADLSYGILNGANLRGTHLRSASLSGADLSGADLTGAGLLEANLVRADLSGTNLSGVDLNGTFLYKTIFIATDLKGVWGLKYCRHLGPSLIDYYTLVESGPLPTVFLRGCGLPDTLIEYLPSLLNQPIQFYSCFISYSTKDQEFADRLYAGLQNEGVRCWFAPHDVQGGKKLHEQIDNAIRMHERLLLILSPNSMESEWVKTEIRKARKRERAEKKRVLFPVRLVSFDAIRNWELFDADEGKDLAIEIREFYIPDFSEWKSHDSYQKEFEKLLRDLRTENKTP